MTVVEKIADDTLVFLQVHKRIWPASQRDALFWSHMRQVPDQNDQDGHDIWIVCNNSTENPDFPVSIDVALLCGFVPNRCSIVMCISCFQQSNSGKCVRVTLTVCLVCQTFIDPPKDGAKITRDNITCKITYCSVGESRFEYYDAHSQSKFPWGHLQKYGFQQEIFFGPNTASVHTYIFQHFHLQN